jgi:hypothetical protein
MPDTIVHLCGKFTEAVCGVWAEGLNLAAKGPAATPVRPAPAGFELGFRQFFDFAKGGLRLGAAAELLPSAAEQELSLPHLRLKRDGRFKFDDGGRGGESISRGFPRLPAAPCSGGSFHVVARR